MKTKTTLTIALVTLLGAESAIAQTTKDEAYARALMQQVEDREDGADSVSRVTIEMADRFGEKYSVEILRLRKDFGPNGRDQYTFSFILSPEELSGTRVLTKDYSEISRLDDQWIHIPGINEIKRIAVDSYTSKLMGSDITYGDLSTRDLDLYDFAYIGSETVGEWKTEIIEFIPRTQEEVVRFGYTKGKVWVDPNTSLVVRSIFEMATSGQSKLFITRKIAQIDGIWTPTDMVFITQKDGNAVSSTRMKLTQTHFNVGLPESLYDVQEMIGVDENTLLQLVQY